MTRTSRRCKKVPIRFNDMIHELDINKNNVRKEACGNEDGDENDGGEKGNLHAAGNGTQSSPTKSQTLPANGVDNSICGGHKSNVSHVNKSVNASANTVIKHIVGNGVSGKSDENIPTVVNEKGEEVVAFDEELVNEGKVRWKNTVCGYFVGCSVPVYEVKYNLRRMWGKHGLFDIVIDEEELCFVKFKNEEGMNYVINESPWMVNRKPFIVQKWDHKGISILASRLGRPIMMDQMTSDMCNRGIGRLGYARVLVEIEAAKEVRNRRNKNNMAGGYDVNRKGEDQNRKNKQKVNEEANSETPRTEKIWNIGSSNVNELNKNASKYVVLSEDNDERNKDSREIMIDKRLIVDEFIKNKTQPSIFDTKDWSFDMINYFKYAWKAMERRNEDDSEEEDVYENTKPFIQSIIADEVIGKGNGSRKTFLGKIKTYISVIYASNNGIERRELWDNLLMNKSVVNDKPWIIMVDFNVTLKPKEHSNRGSGINGDMHEFNDVFNGVEVEDIYRSPILLVFLEGLPKKVKSFRFTNYIAYKEEFLILWLKNGIGVCMDVTYAQKEDDKDPSNVDKRKFAVKILKEYTEVASDELKLLHQKAKIDWLRDGDKNTSYFHSMLKAKKHNNRVESTISLDQLGQIVNLKLSCEDVEAMIVEVTDVEIKEAIFDIDSSKASGPDGYTSCSSKKAWGIIRKEVCLAVKEFFSNQKLLGEVNATLISLVPKIDTPNKISGFRPISYCSVLYKCISKIITNMIKIGLNKVISINQSAFIPGRHIHDNILLTQELLRGYDRKQRAKVGFHEVMVNWIMKCISTASFSICVNGEICSYFKGGRGLRQGDSMSPYLFTLVMEVPNMTTIKNIKEDNNFKYHHRCKELKLTHLCSTDDLLMLCNGDTELLKFIKKSLDEFSSVSGMIQLIASVLSTMQSYWASMYMLPITVLNDLEKLLRRVMWSSGVFTKGKAKVAWSFMCRPKDRGGLGLKLLCCPMM
ncbi:RNA-directed DNA polymerase, eukaryota, reverse transcriptase zinc-binding domain protein [Tanacetum coccineum]